MALSVSQSPSDVFSAWTDAKGQPFPLQRASNEEAVYVNPTTVAYFEEATARATTE